MNPDAPLLNQVGNSKHIYVSVKLKLNVEWKGVIKPISYYTNVRNDSIIQSAITAFSIVLPAEELQLTSFDKEPLPSNGIIPFNGYRQLLHLTTRRSSSAVKSSSPSSIEAVLDTMNTNRVLYISFRGKKYQFDYDEQNAVDLYFSLILSVFNILTCNPIENSYGKV